MSTVLLVVALTLFVLAILSHVTTKRKREAVKNIVGPYNLPIVGAVHFAYQLNPESKKQKKVLPNFVGVLFTNT